MWVTLFAPLGKCSRLSGIIGNWKCSLRRLSTQSTGNDGQGRRHWTAEENRKLESLFKQGVRTVGIMREMKDRSYASITHRVTSLVNGVPLRDGVEGKKPQRPWSVEENALMLEKMEQGLKTAGMISYFPDRSFNSVDMHALRLSLRPTAQVKKSDELPAELFQRIIDMRLKETKTIREIASELGLSHEKIDYLWETQCVKMLSKEMRDRIRWHRVWTPNETKHLTELHCRGTLSIKEATLQFPSKSLRAVATKASRERLLFPKFSQEP